MSDDPVHLRQQAARARRLAMADTANDITTALNALAIAYELRATALESGQELSTAEAAVQIPMPPVNG